MIYIFFLVGMFLIKKIFGIFWEYHNWMFQWDLFLSQLSSQFSVFLLHFSSVYILFVIICCYLFVLFCFCLCECVFSWDKFIIVHTIICHCSLEVFVKRIFLLPLPSGFKIFQGINHWQLLALCTCN